MEKEMNVKLQRYSYSTQTWVNCSPRFFVWQQDVGYFLRQAEHFSMWSTFSMPKTSKKPRKQQKTAGSANVMSE